MLFPSNIEEKLGFDRIRSMTFDACLSEMGQTLVEKIRFQKSYEVIESQISAVHEMMVARGQGGFPAIATPDIREHIKRFDVHGAFLTEKELHEVFLVADSTLRIMKFLSKQAEELPTLAAMVDQKASDGLEHVVEEITKILEPDGTMRINASPRHAELVESIAKLEKKIQAKVRQVYSKAKESGWAAETEITIRDGRPVVPILAEHKRKIPGMVHDESGGGKLFYIEPLEVLEMNSALVELELELKREVIRILRKVSKAIRNEGTAVRAAVHMLGVFDLVRAKAVVSEKLQSVKPEIVRDPKLSLVNAKHPFLYLKYKDEKKEVVPLTLEIDSDQRMIVISGPNAGGKSVCLKTVALLQYMFQCGYPIPADESSEIGIFENIFVDIGDDQSIENDLSSYSSHLVAMKHFISFSNANTLCLIDELGSGTDPQFGGPMAEAVLESIHAKAARAVITTHFSNIKSFADKAEGIVNGAMAYDVEHLEPLFELRVGLPGSSFAYEVSKKIGLQKKVIELAKSKTDYTQQKLDYLLADLEKEKKELKSEKERVQAMEAQLERLKSEYNTLKSSLDERKKEIIDQAKRRALSIIENANRDVEGAIRNIREIKAEKVATQKIREELKHKKEALKIVQKEVIPEKRSLKVGDRVQMPGTENFGEVVSIKKDKAVVMVGAMKTTFPVAMLEPVSRQKEKKFKSQGPSRDLIDRNKTFKTEIDLRGMRAEEALKQLDKWIDEAMVLGFGSLRVIHGKGDGILKERIRQHLKGQPFIEKIEYESVQLGGEGVSLIYLK